MRRKACFLGFGTKWSPGSLPCHALTGNPAWSHCKGPNTIILTLLRKTEAPVLWGRWARYHCLFLGELFRKNKHTYRFHAPLISLTHEGRQQFRQVRTPPRVLRRCTRRKRILRRAVCARLIGRGYVAALRCSRRKAFSMLLLYHRCVIIYRGVTSPGVIRDLPLPL